MQSREIVGEGCEGDGIHTVGINQRSIFLRSLAFSTSVIGAISEVAILFNARAASSANSGSISMASMSLTWSGICDSGFVVVISGFKAQGRSSPVEIMTVMQADLVILRSESYGGRPASYSKFIRLISPTYH